MTNRNPMPDPLANCAQTVDMGHKLNKKTARKLAHAMHKSEIAHPESERAIYKRLRKEVLP